VVTEPSLVSQSEHFESTVVSNGDKATLEGYCASKAQAEGVRASSGGASVAAAAQEEAETWTFLSLLFAEVSRGGEMRREGVLGAVRGLNLVPVSMHSMQKHHQSRHSLMCKVV
jgi:hypothetical protein